MEGAGSPRLHDVVDDDLRMLLLHVVAHRGRGADVVRQTLPAHLTDGAPAVHRVLRQLEVPPDLSLLPGLAVSVLGATGRGGRVTLRRFIQRHVFYTSWRRCVFVGTH